MRSTLTQMTKKLYAQQSKLPRLPVPALEETLEKYLESAEPFLNADELKRSKQLVDNFKSGQGVTLQQRLLDRSTKKENWLIDWWNSQGYLEPRDPVTPYSNYYFYHRHLIGNNQSTVAASLIKATLAFKHLVDSEQLEPENIKGTPLCTETYQFLFNSSRVPLKNSDKVVKFDQSNQHVVVLSNNRFFKLDVNNSDNLESQLDHIIKISYDRTGDAVGALTTENRDTWSDARQHIQSLSNSNSNSLKQIDSAALIVALDSSSPISRDKASWGAWVGDGRNRWFDKHQIIVYKNGKSAFNAEHSAMDASKKITLGEKSSVKQSDVEELPFELDSKALDYITNAEKHHDAIMGAHTMDVIQYDGYGANLIKSNKISPDAWVQMIKQLAFWKLRGRAPGVYESCQTRKFLYGRTEVIRPTSNESTKFVHLMRDVNASDADRISALHAAAKRHLKYAGWAANGVAVDRHIYGLKNCIEQGEDIHPALKDAALARSSKWELSTSQLSSPLFDGWGFSEVTPDGFGLGYAIQDKSIRWTITCTNGEGKELGHCLTDQQYNSWASSVKYLANHNRHIDEQPKEKEQAESQLWRRLKLKCDREWPCTSCKKRGCAAICPDGTLKGGTMSRTALVSNTASLLTRIDQLESALKNAGEIVPPPTEPIISSAAYAFNSPPPLQEQTFHEEDFAESFGSLTLGISGQARYVGPSAGSEWLQNEAQISDNELESERLNEGSPVNLDSPNTPPSDFPFPGATNESVITQMWSQLPPIDKARRLSDKYFDYDSCLYYVIPQEIFDEDFEIIYSGPIDVKFAHQLARLYMILAIGLHCDVDEPFGHPDCHKYFCSAKTLLNASEFMTKCSLATAQTLHLMGSYLLNRNRLSGADSYWPLLGVQMRIIQAMGLHRDGARWGFDQRQLNERRRTFWESHTIDVFQSICFGRPYSTHARHIDCEFPMDEEARNFHIGGKDEGYGFHTLKFKLVKHLCRISDDIYGVNPPPYETVIHVDRGIREFEKNIPPHLRCKAASLVRNSSNYPIEEDSGGFSEKLALQQHTLALNVNECLLYLNRRYFAHALKTYPQDPLRSPFSQSYVAVMECCRVIVALVRSIHTLIPELSTRHWYFFHHLFSCGICAAASCILSPGSAMASEAWKDLCEIIDLCALPTAGKRANAFVPALDKLRKKAHARCMAHLEARGTMRSEEDEGIDDEHLVLLGLGSRVVNKGHETRIRTPARSRSYSVQTRVPQSKADPHDALWNSPISDSAAPKFYPNYKDYGQEGDEVNNSRGKSRRRGLFVGGESGEGDEGDNGAATSPQNTHTPIHPQSHSQPLPQTSTFNPNVMLSSSNTSDQIYEALLQTSAGTSSTEMFNSLWDFSGSNKPIPQLNSSSDNCYFPQINSFNAWSNAAQSGQPPQSLQQPVQPSRSGNATQPAYSTHTTNTTNTTHTSSTPPKDTDWNHDTENEDYAAFRNVEAIIVPVGDLDEDSTFRKSTSLQNWLLGYEFPTTISVFLPDNTIIFIASNTKTKILKQLENAADINVELVTKTKDQEATKKALEGVVDKLSGKTIGLFMKEEATGKSIEDWNNISSGKFGQEVDITPAMASVTAPKDLNEQRNHKYASQLSSHLLKWGIDKIMGYIDSEKKINHFAVAELIERKAAKNEDHTDANDLTFWKKLKNFNEIEYSSSETVYTPIIQSGGEYNLKPSAMSNENNLKAGVITASLGMRYKSYCSNIGRTFFIDPHKSQEENYTFLLELQKRVLSKMTPGTQLSTIYETAVDFIRKTKPDLLDKLSKNLGFATGIYFRDSTFMISQKSTRTISKGMVFNLAIGFTDIKDPKSSGKNYALSLIDTVLVTDEGGNCLTEGNKSNRDVMLFMENDDEEDTDVEVKPKKASSPKKKRPSGDLDGAVVGSRMLRGKTRNAGRETDQSTSHKIKEHQRILHEAKNEEGLQRFAGGKDSSNGSQPGVFRRFDSYKREQQVPINRDLRILVDTKAQTVIIPINGFIVPVHVSTIKNTSKTEEGDYTSLRINFITPGQSVGKKEDMVFEDPDSMFIRSVTFRSTDKLRFSDLNKDINELKKLSTKRAAEKREMADVVEQEKLTEIRGRRPTRLGEVFARPIEGKRLAGDLDIHANGVRYTTPTRDQKIDVLFSNVKHFFFQPCEHELVVLVHFHLKAPIMIGKKKTRDVQFYREASDASFDDTGNRKRKIRYGDEDEIELEQEERRRRNALNKEFKAFAEKVAEASEDRFDVDIPYRELGFQGVPNRTGVLLQPTTECLVQLTDPPFTIITLAEVELAHLERVSFGLKTFDIVFVFSDFTKPVMHINSIQASQLDNVKEWLDSSDIPLSEGPASLNWGAVMKTVNEDPKDFFESGGWTFLGGSGEAEQGSDESEPESTYDMSEDASDDDDEGSDDFDDSDGGSESDASDASEVSGESWDALERRAEKSDRKHYKGGEEEAESKSKGRRR
ncbi:hypothetical protein E3P89_03431 [Wallemia ichthyophaga]|uniref:FACT complex subunit n=1 Tax=Wallemia ichthyophaga TaxID=245174 RepID=A0A4T0HX90_WALIC|nr:hypothetical protein E3P98_03407 [Wallemia ichthyophaga]TIA94907.1 hypothetical protein E3P95_03988 [Wallemia ichthyophaga]TIA95680.1 hypothetical protein E3P94_03972 [Wallemia ichthyophaga]TIB08673.1 hypothetical protein E3P93_03414 [Wallemia ichthyophaga]TIB09056.1 hypothetical protein E3P90_03414 [Wallemia ichthyophaga]